MEVSWMWQRRKFPETRNFSIIYLGFLSNLCVENLMLSSSEYITLQKYVNQGLNIHTVKVIFILEEKQYGHIVTCIRQMDWSPKKKMIVICKPQRKYLWPKKQPRWQHAFYFVSACKNINLFLKPSPLWHIIRLPE